MTDSDGMSEAEQARVVEVALALLFWLHENTNPAGVAKLSDVALPRLDIDGETPTADEIDRGWSLLEQEQCVEFRSSWQNERLAVRITTAGRETIAQLIEQSDQ